MTSSATLPTPEAPASSDPTANSERLPNPEPLFVSDALLEQAEQMCRRRLANDPNNRTVLASLAQICRKQGNLSEATTLYERLSLLEPQDEEAKYMHAILAAGGVPSCFRPAPFVFLKDFLPSSFHDTLLPFVLSTQEKLVPALVGKGDYKPDLREALDLPGQWEVKRRFREYVREIIPTVAPRLHVAAFEIDFIEVMLRAYLDGHFFRVHMDCPPGFPRSAHRKVSFVYFFHKVPRAYSGGELLLFDSDIVTDRFTTARFTRVVPEDNSIILFPSAYYHSVVPVRCPSKQYADSRFVINGHVSKRMPAPVETATGTVETLVTPAANGEPEALVSAGVP